jgi:hypothetical protein
MSREEGYPRVLGVPRLVDPTGALNRRLEPQFV